MSRAENERSDAVVSLERLGFPKDSVIIRPPSADLFFAGQEKSSFLPAHIAENSTLIEQAHQRRMLYSLFSELFTKVEDATQEWSEACQKGIISVEEIEHLYIALTEFLSTDPQNARLLLYLPFEMIVPPGFVDETVYQKFRATYERAWLRILAENESRANYVDGDNPEAGRGEPVRVYKAAHLLPQLLAREVYTVPKVIHLLEVIHNPLLEQNIFEGLRAAFHQSILDPGDIALLKRSTRPSVVTFATQLLEEESSQRTDMPPVPSVEEFLTDLKRALTQHKQRYASDGEVVRTMSKSRYTWENSDRYEKILARAAQEFAHMLVSVPNPSSLFAIEDETIQAEISRSTIQGIFIAIEHTAQRDRDEAIKLFETYKTFLESSWKTDSLVNRNDLYRGWAHLLSLGILDTKYLQQFGLTIPDMTAVVSVDLEQLATNDLHGVKKAIEHVQKDDDIKRYFYPVFVLHGSRPKAYATLLSDSDLVGFRKVETAGEDPSFTQAQTVLAQATMGLETMQSYCLREENDVLQLVNPDHPDRNTLSPQSIQTLLGGVWIGEKNTVGEIYTAVMDYYLGRLATGSKEQQEQARFSFLRQLELETLQARLLHRGYRFFHADKIPPSLKNEEAIDGDSTFWDSGYRRVATQLFLSRVFLPAITP